MLPALATALASTLLSPQALTTQPTASAEGSATVSVEASAEASADAETGTKKAKKSRPHPAERLAQLDEKRVAVHLGARAYARTGGVTTFESGPGRTVTTNIAGGAALQLGLGVRLVRGLYIHGEFAGGAHAEPFGANVSGFLGLHHELRKTKWVRPSYFVGYRHIVETDFRGQFDGSFDGSYEQSCGGCTVNGNVGGGGQFEFDSRTDLVHRPAVQAGLGLRFPMPFAPRLSPYVRGDVSYAFDDRFGNLEVGVQGGIQLVF